MNLFGMLEVSGSALGSGALAGRGGGGEHGERADDTHFPGRRIPAATGGVSRAAYAAFSFMLAKLHRRSRRA
jgi:hypothetical protein